MTATDITPLISRVKFRYNNMLGYSNYKTKFYL